MKSPEFTRRNFLGMSIGAAVLTGIGCSESTPTANSNTGAGGNSGTGGTSGKDGGGTAGAGGNNVNGGATGVGGSTGAGEKAYVSLVRQASEAEADVIAATMAAIVAAGDFPDLTGKVVMLRPNAIDAAPPGSVNPAVIKGVIRAIKLRGTPSQIIVADDTFTGSTLTQMGTNGIRAATEAEGATAKGLENTTTRTITNAAATSWPNGMKLYTAALDADYLINIPVCKTHSLAYFSMALKGWYGNIAQSDRIHGSATAIGNALAQLHMALQEDFVVLDATKCLLTGGPTVGNGKTASPGIVVAGTDPIAVDVTGVCILRQYLQTTGNTNAQITNTAVWSQAQIASAMALKIGTWLTGKTSFTYAAQNISEAATIMAYRD